jgi:hypothetical protein
VSIRHRRHVEVGGAKGFKIGRDNETGRLKSVDQAKANPRGSSVEVMPKKGNGDTGRYDNKKK